MAYELSEDTPLLAFGVFKSSGSFHKDQDLLQFSKQIKPELEALNRKGEAAPDFSRLLTIFAEFEKIHKAKPEKVKQAVGIFFSSSTWQTHLSPADKSLLVIALHGNWINSKSSFELYDLVAKQLDADDNRNWLEKLFSR